MAPQDKIGRLTYDLVPDAKSAEKELAKLRVPKINLEVEFSRKQINTALKAATTPPLDIKVVVKPQLLAKDVNTAVKEVNKKKLTAIRPPVRLDARQVNREIKSLKAKNLSNITIGVDAKTGEAIAEIKAIATAANRSENTRGSLITLISKAEMAEFIKNSTIVKAATRAFAVEQAKAFVTRTNAALRLNNELRRQSAQTEQERVRSANAADQSIRVGREKLENSLTLMRERSLLRGRRDDPFLTSVSKTLSSLSTSFSRFESSGTRALRILTVGFLGFNAVVGATAATLTTISLINFAQLETSARNAAAIFAELEVSTDRFSTAQARTNEALRQGAITTRQAMSAATQASLRSTFSAKDSGDALFYLASAGIRAKDAMASLVPITQFAQAGMFDVQEASELLLQSVNVTGIGMARLGEAADLLTTANIRSQTTLEDLSKALTNNSGAAFRLYGQDISTTIGLLQELGNVGITGLKAGEGLAIAIREVVRAASGAKDTDKAVFSTRFKELGIEVFDANGNAKEFSATLDLLADKLGNLPAKQQALELKSLGFTDRSLKALRSIFVRSLQLRKEGSSLAAEVAQLKADAGGAVQRISEQQLQTFSASIKLFKNQSTAILRDFASPIAFAIQRSLKDLIKPSGGLFDALKDEARDFGADVAVILGNAFEFLRSDRGKDALKDLGTGFKEALAGIRDFGREFSKAFNDGEESGKNFFEIMATGFKALGKFDRTVLQVLGKGLGRLVKIINDNRTSFKLLGIALATTFTFVSLNSRFFRPMVAALDLVTLRTRAFIASIVAARAANAAPIGFGPLSARGAAAGGATVAGGAAASNLTAATGGAVASTGKLTRLLFSPVGLIAGVGLAAVGIGLYAKKQREATRDALALSLTTSGTKDSIDGFSKSFSDLSFAVDDLSTSISDVNSLASGQFVKILSSLTVPDNIGESTKVLKDFNDELSRRDKILDALEIGHQKEVIALGKAKFTYLDTKKALDKINTSVRGDKGRIEAIDSAIKKVRELRDATAESQRAGLGTGDAAQAAARRGAEAESALGNSREIVASLGGVNAATRTRNELEDALNRNLLRRQELNLALSQEENRIASTRKTTLKEAVDAERARRGRESGFASLFTTTGTDAAIKKSEALVQQARKQRETLKLLLEDAGGGQQKFAEAILNINTGIKGAVDTTSEVKILAGEISKIGQTPTGANFLKTFGPNIDKLLRRAKKGKIDANTFLAEIGKTKTDRQFIRRLGVDLDASAVTAKTKGKAVTTGLGKGMEQGFTEAVSPFLASINTKIKSIASGSNFGGLGGAAANVVGQAKKALSKNNGGGTGSDLLVANGAAVMVGFKSGMEKYYKGTIKPFLSVTIPKWIGEHKGPVAYDATILVPAGQAVMQGFESGLRSGFSGVQSFIERVGPSIEESVPESLVLDRTAKFMVQLAKGNTPDVDKFFGDLVPDVSAIGAIGAPSGDGTLSFLHKSLSLTDTTKMAQMIAGIFGTSVGSTYRSPSYNAAVGGAVNSFHTRGLAADYPLGGGTSAGELDKMDASLGKYLGGVLNELIWRSEGHFDHLHLAFNPAAGFSLGSGKLGSYATADAKGSGGAFGASGPNTPFSNIFAQASSMFHVPAALLKAVAKAESGFSATAGSSAGARGVMQLIPSTFASMNVGSNILDPKQNIFAGSKYLAAQLKAFHSNRLALAAYNAGPGAVALYGGVPPFGETQAYVERVLKYFKDFGGFRADGGPVQAGKSYMVGERGPELVSFGRNGSVVTNERIDRMISLLEKQQGGGVSTGGTINVTSNAVDPAVVAGIVLANQRRIARSLT